MTTIEPLRNAESHSSLGRTRFQECATHPVFVRARKSARVHARPRALLADSYGITLWDLTTGDELQTVQRYTWEERYQSKKARRDDRPTAVTVLPDGQRALTGDVDGTLTLWSLVAGTAPQTFAGHASEVTALTVRSDGRLALSGSNDGSVKLWDIPTCTVLQTFGGHKGRVTAVEVLPDGLHALSSSYDGSLKLWDFSTVRPLKTLGGHSGRATGLATLPDGQRALSCTDDGMVKLWDLASGEVLSTFYDDAPLRCVSPTTHDCGVVVGNALGRVYMLTVE